jgi:hypothetical protein
VGEILDEITSLKRCIASQAEAIERGEMRERLGDEFHWAFVGKFFKKHIKLDAANAELKKSLRRLVKEYKQGAMGKNGMYNRKRVLRDWRTLFRPHHRRLDHDLKMYLNDMREELMRQTPRTESLWPMGDNIIHLPLQDGAVWYEHHRYNTRLASGGAAAAVPPVRTTGRSTQNDSEADSEESYCVESDDE